MPDMNEMRVNEIEVEMLDNRELLKDEKKEELEKKTKELKDLLNKFNKEEPNNVRELQDKTTEVMKGYIEVYGKGYRKILNSYTCRNCGALHEDIDEYYAFCHYCGKARRSTKVNSLHGR